MNQITSITQINQPITYNTEQVKAPPTRLASALETAKKVACFALSIFSDLILGLCALGLVLFALCYKSNFDPSADQVKTDKPPILMIHGNGSNEMQWVVGRQFLSGDKYGSVFTLNLDGLLTNEDTKGIDDYAIKVNQKIDEIKKLTGRTDVTLIGHSMGGLIASYYAENLSKSSNTQVDRVITISSPWHGSPLLRRVTKITETHLPSLFKDPKRYQQMNNANGFLDTLRDQALESEQKKIRRYYSIYSDADMLVFGKSGSLPASHTKSYSYLGHFSPMIFPPVWNQIQNWLAVEA